jgi:hypothetical protein
MASPDQGILDGIPQFQIQRAKSLGLHEPAAINTFVLQNAGESNAHMNFGGTSQFIFLVDVTVASIPCCADRITNLPLLETKH